MPDITMCRNEECPKNKECFRYMALPNPYRQAFAAFTVDEKGECHYYMSIGPERAGYKLRNLDDEKKENRITEKSSKVKKSLLLYLECRAVDNSGIVDIQYMNDVDLNLAKVWDEEGYIQFARRASQYFTTDKKGTYIVKLSANAMEDAHALRAARAKRNDSWYQSIREIENA
jgi:hypothetical protein